MSRHLERLAQLTALDATLAKLAAPVAAPLRAIASLLAETFQRLDRIEAEDAKRAARDAYLKSLSPGQ